MTYDFLIVGAGLSGCVFAERISSLLNKRVMMVDTRDHIGGNCYDYYNEDGILIHKYGPHWFHTNDLQVFTYLSQFTEWHLHEHKVRSYMDGVLYPFPINRDTINQLYGLNLETTEAVSSFFDSVRVKEITSPRNAEEMIISQVGWDLYDKFYRNYTIKQWNRTPDQLQASVTARIPIRTNTDDRYFTDSYQGVPRNGYSSMFNNMISSKKITVVLETDYKKCLRSVSFRKMIYTGPIDYFFDYKYGKLPYRSLQFEHQTLDMEYYQPYQQVNYPNDFSYTRIVEWKHATGQQHKKTTITKEYPCPADENNEKLYPILTNETLELVKKYKIEAAKLQNVKFCGRLAEYKYYNMDQIVARALYLFENEVKQVSSWTK